MMCDNSNSSPRFNEHKVPVYSNKSLLGNWYEDRLQYRKYRYRHGTTYTQDYIPRVPPLSEDSSKNAIQSAGLPKAMLFGQREDAYTNNFSTTYDLSYNHFVKKAKTHPTERHWVCRDNIWLPEKDFTKDYGNITRYGIFEYKTSLWEQERNPSHNQEEKSEYQESYECVPKMKPVKRFATPLKNSSLMNPSNIYYHTLTLRDMHLCTVTPNEEVVVIPRKHRDNPITWE
nr:uncharacterized protein LOC111426904 [Onthophagus taurus]